AKAGGVDGESARRAVMVLLDRPFSNGLPANLVFSPGLHSGFKGMQLSQTTLVVACRQIAGPSSIHTLPTEQYNKDIVSPGLHSSLTACEMSRWCAMRSQSFCSRSARVSICER